MKSRKQKSKQMTNRVTLTDKTEKTGIIVQPSKVWKAAHHFKETIKRWAVLGVSGSFAATLLITLTTADFKDAFSITAATWKGFYLVGLLISAGFFGFTGLKLIQIYSRNGVTSEDKFVEELFNK